MSDAGYDYLTGKTVITFRPEAVDAKQFLGAFITASYKPLYISEPTEIISVGDNGEFFGFSEEENTTNRDLILDPDSILEIVQNSVRAIQSAQLKIRMWRTQFDQTKTPELTEVMVPYTEVGKIKLLEI